VSPLIVDTHVHLYPPEVIRDADRITEREPYFRLLSGNRVHRWATAEDLIARMDREGIDQAWAFPFAFVDPGLCREGNDYLIDAARRYPGRIRPFAVVNPLASGAEEEIRRCADAGCLGVGELFPEGQGFDVDDSRQTWRLAGACHETGSILLVHTAEPVGHDYPGKGGVGPREAATFCLNHPEVRVVWAHFGGGLFLYEAMPEMRIVLKNARYDCAAAPFLYGPEIFSAALSVVPEKIFFGSDYPILGFPRYGRLLEGAALAPGRLEAVLSGNANRFIDETRQEESAS
jgi:predicted TIM-barrel fold metal-dependent hydrolase